jgi:hypothetical protein
LQRAARRILVTPTAAAAPRAIANRTATTTMSLGASEELRFYSNMLKNNLLGPKYDLYKIPGPKGYTLLGARGVLACAASAGASRRVRASMRMSAAARPPAAGAAAEHWLKHSPMQCSRCACSWLGRRRKSVHCCAHVCAHVLPRGRAGHIPYLLRHDYHIQALEWANKFGGICRFSLGGQHIILVSGACWSWVCGRVRGACAGVLPVAPCACLPRPHHRTHAAS